MKILAEKFEKYGEIFDQYEREGNVALYARKNKKTGKVIDYEVIIINSHDGFYKGDQWIEPAETYASSNQWGRNGFTYTKKEFDKARERFNSLVEEEKEKNT